MTFDAGGALVIGTGGKGRIYRVTGEPSQTVLLTRAPAQQVTMFLQGADGQNYYATANPARSSSCHRIASRTDTTNPTCWTPGRSRLGG